MGKDCFSDLVLKPILGDPHQLSVAADAHRYWGRGCKGSIFYPDAISTMASPNSRAFPLGISI